MVMGAVQCGEREQIEQVADIVAGRARVCAVAHSSAVVPSVSGWGKRAEAERARGREGAVGRGWTHADPLTETYSHIRQGAAQYA